MSLNQLDNCPSCGKLFIKGQMKICKDCHKKVEEMYQRVYHFLMQQENRKATIHEVSEGTAVSVSQIKTFITQGRLQVDNFPNMGYPCERCGTLIKKGSMCEPCRSKLTNQLKQAIETGHDSVRKNGPHNQQDDYEILDKGYRQLKDE